MLQSVQKLQSKQVFEHNSVSNSADQRGCQRCHGAFEPGRKLKAATRYCYACALWLRRARVAAWKQRKLDEIGPEQFLADYGTCREKRRESMRLYMRKRRAQVTQPV